MLRLRAQSGKTVTMDEPLLYVEVLDSEDKVAMVFHREEIAGADSVNLITSGSDSARSYSKLYGVEWSANLHTDWVAEEPVEFSRS